MTVHGAHIYTSKGLAAHDSSVHGVLPHLRQWIRFHNERKSLSLTFIPINGVEYIHVYLTVFGSDSVSIFNTLFFGYFDPSKHILTIAKNSPLGVWTDLSEQPKKTLSSGRTKSHICQCLFSVWHLTNSSTSELNFRVEHNVYWMLWSKHCLLYIMKPSIIVWVELIDTMLCMVI